ncbi:uncharacterized protein LOC111120425 isoform X2 [Crassostrea virginica]
MSTCCLIKFLQMQDWIAILNLKKAIVDCSIIRHHGYATSIFLELKDEGKAVESALETSLTSSLGEGETENDIFEHSLDETQEQNEISENVYATETRHKFVGEFNVPLSSIKFAAEDRAVRELNPTHIAELEASFRTNLANGIRINFPPATGVIFEEEFRNEVELIDGNHTHHVMLHMQELYQEKEELKTRKVIVYRELSQGAISFLGLSRNDETTNSLKTSHFEELKIMGKLLYSKHGGKFSNRYQDDIYQLFNALCPGDRKEESKRKKRLQHLIRLSTMDQGCWELVVKIKDKHPIPPCLHFGTLAV